ncbi:MAG: ABC transporter substrate-binding protein [Endomicrobiales bacterium]
MVKRLAMLVCVFLAVAPLSAQPPRRIVSFVPSITASLCHLGVQENIVGVTIFCPPDAGDRAERIGTIHQPNVEKIVSLSPDIVIVNKESNKNETVEKLESLGIAVFTLEGERSFNDICSNFLRLGKLVGREDRARNIVKSVREQAAQIRSRAPEGRPLRVFWEIGAQPLVTVNKNTFVNDYNKFLGVENIFNDVAAAYPRVSREEVIKRDPDVIIIVTMGNVTGQEQKIWQRFNTVKAVRQNSIYIVEAEKVLTPTPLNFLQGLEIIAATLRRQVR